MKKQPIGVFDSGIGGLSILKQLVNILPNENMIYLADSANAPYGQRSSDEILALSKKNVDFLISKNCKLIVVACNTATTNAIKILRKDYLIPFIGIEPAIKPAALSTKTKAIGILATKGTLSSAMFTKTTDFYAQNIDVVESVGKGLVEFIENGDFNSPALETLLRAYIKPMIASHIDYLVLGCTHYPYLIPLLEKILPQNIKIIDSGEAVAKQTNAVMIKQNLKNEKTSTGKLSFFTNKDINALSKIVKLNFENIQSDFSIF